MISAVLHIIRIVINYQLKLIYKINYNTTKIIHVHAIATDQSLFVGSMTRQKLNQLLEEGDISPHQITVFYQAVREFYTTAVEYALSHLPFKDEVLENAQFAHFQSREAASVSQVLFFVSR